MGNVSTDLIADIWHGPGFKFYREKHLSGRGKDIPLCPGCPDLEVPVVEPQLLEGRAQC